ncbi:class C beta-lactamase [Rhizobium rhizophilum]|uniref:Beta-lactamase n=1 Tax=Rhizobium rhizophilum TaxID=1850373 RepID=A0ABY2QRK8_9HYPH|nr:class C beta-lactamase [Rhizobium rhizophilum]THV12490.1 beta-lactamase [Rhizobium rhizophilum]
MRRASCLVSFAFAFCSQATNALADDISKIAETAFGPIIKEYAIPGLVVGVTRNGEHSFYTFGLASQIDGVKVTPDTLFELGSISKIFNVTLAALAEERGNLSLDDTVAQHLCAEPCSIAGDLTLMDLATHRTGGMPLQIPDSVSSEDELVDWLEIWRPLQPEARSYSNISIGLLGYITGQAFEGGYKRAVQDLLFPALGLTNTWIDVPRTKMSQYAFGYDRKTNAAIRVNPGLLDAEAYGVKSSARDMLKVLDTELGVGIIADDLRNAVARTQQPAYRTAYFEQAMIWERYSWPVDPQRMLLGNSSDFILNPQPTEELIAASVTEQDVILSKTGSTNGFGGYVAVVPSENMGVVVLANKNYPNEARVKATMALFEAIAAD